MFLLLLKQVVSKNGVIVGLVTVIILSVSSSYRDHQELKKIQSVYANPEIKTVEHIVYREGPIKIVTKTIIQKDRTYTVTTEERSPVIILSDSETAKTPIPIAVTMAAARTDRYLLTVGLNRLTPDFDGKALFVGYSIHNRFDFQVGGIQHDGFSPWLLATVRF